MRRLIACMFASFVVLGLLAVPTRAADDKPMPTPEEMFKKKDKDGDGKLTEAEFLGKQADPEKVEKAKARFKKLDKDSDGSLSLEEFVAGVKPKK